jgi:putative sterol carrier protein
LLLVNHFGSNSFFLGTSKMVMPVSKTLLSSLLRTTTSPVLLVRSFASPAFYHNVNDIVERFKSVNIPGWQSKIGATYYFKVEDGSSFLVDLKNAEGATKGGVHYTETAPVTPVDVTVTATTANLLKMFNRELEAMVMVEEGKVHLAGEIEKAITLQKVMIELREGEKPHYYHSVNDIITRFKTVNLPGWKTKVGSTFYFDIKDGEKFLVDLKTIDGASKGGVIEGICPTTITPDVIVTTTTEHMLKMFNREGDSIKMIMEGHVKVTGEFDKLLSLKEVMIAAREAESH